MARRQKNKSDSATGTNHPSTNTPRRKRGRPPLDPINWQTPKGTTPDKRDHHAKSKVVAIIGQMICLVTGWVTLSYFLQCVHIVPRTLHKTNKDWYHRLRKSVGIIVDGKRELNLDNTGNQDIFHLNIHKIWDGPGVTSNIAQGGIAMTFSKKEWRRNLRTLEEGFELGQDYRQMFPEVFYTYGLYSMSAKPKHLIGLYSTEPRKYDHIVKDDRTLQVMRKEDCEDSEAFHSIEVEDDTEASRQLGPDYLPPGAPTPEDTSNTPTTRILTVGVQESIVLVSHLNPVFIIWDYALKMFYRICVEPQLADELPREDVRFFIEEIWPIVGFWFTDNHNDYFKDYVFDTDESDQPANSNDEFQANDYNDLEGDTYDSSDAESDDESAGRPVRVVKAKTHQPTTASHKISMPKRPAKTSIRFSFPKASSDSSDASDRSATPCPSGSTFQSGMKLGTPGSAIPKTARRNLNVDGTMSNGAQVLEPIPEREEWEDAKDGARSPSEGPFQPPDDTPPESSTSDKASRINRYATVISRKAKSMGFTLGKRASERTTLKGTSFTFKASTTQFGHPANHDPPGTEPSAWRASDTADAEGEPTDGSAPNTTSTDPPGASDATAAGPSTAGPSVPQPITRPRRSQPKRNYKEASSSDGFSDAGDDVDNPPPKRLRMKPPAQKGAPAKKGAIAKKKGRG